MLSLPPLTSTRGAREHLAPCSCYYRELSLSPHKEGSVSGGAAMILRHVHQSPPPEGLVAKAINNGSSLAGIGSVSETVGGVLKPINQEPRREPQQLTSEDLKLITSNFNESNFVGTTQFAKVFRGTNLTIEGQSVTVNLPKRKGLTVKIWDERADYLIFWDQKFIMVEEEILFLGNVTHRFLPKLIGYCCEEKMKAVVYDFDPLYTLSTLVLSDDYDWTRRISVALKFAELLQFLHAKGYIVFNLDPDHMIVDKDNNPILIDFGTLSGGIIGEMNVCKREMHMTPGYGDQLYFRTGWVGAVNDVYSYGQILLALIAKRLAEDFARPDDICLLDFWARKVCREGGSLVHESLEKDEGYRACDGIKLKELAMRCIEERDFGKRPAMQEVVESLKRLERLKEISE